MDLDISFWFISSVSFESVINLTIYKYQSATDFMYLVISVYAAIKARVLSVVI